MKKQTRPTATNPSPATINSLPPYPPPYSVHTFISPFTAIQNLYNSTTCYYSWTLLSYRARSNQDAHRTRNLAEGADRPVSPNPYIPFTHWRDRGAGGGEGKVGLAHLNKHPSPGPPVPLRPTIILRSSRHEMPQPVFNQYIHR